MIIAQFEDCTINLDIVTAVSPPNSLPSSRQCGALTLGVTLIYTGLHVGRALQAFKLICAFWQKNYGNKSRVKEVFVEDSIKRQLMVFGLLLLSGLVLAACSQNEPAQVEVTRIIELPVEVEGPTVEVTRVVEVEVEVPGEPAVTVPFEEEWAGSAHAAAEAEAFVHWNEDDPQEVPTTCAKCHSTTGYQDYIGADGSTANVVDVAVPVGEVIACEACHNDVTLEMDTVLFPSGVELSGLGPQSRCMQCHQGRASTTSVNAGLAEAGMDGEEDLDTVSEEVGFSNIHYYAAAATRLGHEVMGGYEYEGKAYDPRFDHVATYDTCIGCHNPHTLELKLEECAACHSNVTGKVRAYAF